MSRCVQNTVAQLKATGREKEDKTPPITSAGGGAEGSRFGLCESSSSEEEGQGRGLTRHSTRNSYSTTTWQSMW